MPTCVFYYTVTVVDSGVEAVEALKHASPGTYNLVLTVCALREGGWFATFLIDHGCSLEQLHHVLQPLIMVD